MKPTTNPGLIHYNRINHWSINQEVKELDNEYVGEMSRNNVMCNKMKRTNGRGTSHQMKLGEEFKYLRDELMSIKRTL